MKEDENRSSHKSSARPVRIVCSCVGLLNIQSLLWCVMSRGAAGQSTESMCLLGLDRLLSISQDQVSGHGLGARASTDWLTMGLTLTHSSRGARVGPSSHRCRGKGQILFIFFIYFGAISLTYQAILKYWIHLNTLRLTGWRTECS